MWELPDGRIIKHPQKGKTFTIDGVNHPEENLLHWDDETLKKYGILKLTEVPYDQKHYRSIGTTAKVVKGIKNISHTLEPVRTLKELKKKKILLVRSQVSSFLSSTKMYLERALDEPENYPVPDHIKSYRIAVRAKGIEIADAIKAINTYKNLIEYRWDDMWPEVIDTEEPINLSADNL